MNGQQPDHSMLARILAGVGGHPGGSDGYDPPAAMAGRPHSDGVRDLIMAGHRRRLRAAGITGQDMEQILATLLEDQSAPGPMDDKIRGAPDDKIRGAPYG
jgi:hypothetical protein